MSDPPREALVALLARHEPADAHEAASLERMRRYAATLARPFAPEQPEAHFTGSALVVDHDGGRVCLVHHRTLGRWLQPGGHADPADGGRLETTAAREAREELGLDVVPLPGAPVPLDVDVHEIPARGELPAHLHRDVRVALVAAGEPAHDEAESHGARWFTLDEADALADAHDLHRLFGKARALAAARP